MGKNSSIGSSTGRKFHVACVGDSITEGFGASSPMASYPAQLQELLGPGYKVLNFGKSGRTLMRRVYWNNSYWDTTTFSSSLLSRPDVVVIMLGTNDASRPTWSGYRQNFVPAFGQLITEYRTAAQRDTGNPDPKFIIVRPPPLYRKYQDYFRDVVNVQFGELIARAGAETGVPVVSVFEAFAQHCPVPQPGRNASCEWVNDDGCHPRDEGYRIIATVIKDAILNVPPTTSSPQGWLDAARKRRLWVTAGIFGVILIIVMAVDVFLDTGYTVAICVGLGCCEKIGVSPEDDHENPDSARSGMLGSPQTGGYELVQRTPSQMPLVPPQYRVLQHMGGPQEVDGDPDGVMGNKSTVPATNAYQQQEDPRPVIHAGSNVGNGAVVEQSMHLPGPGDRPGS